uniref:LytR/AlgR family response regulator transcription factor n=1 Tax=Flavobacterium sp. TaxID=239 RepID=UPI00404B05FB
MNATPKILIVEDEVLIAEFVMELLQEENFTEVIMAHDEEETLLYMNTFLPDIILMDINLNGQNSGIELAKMKNENAALIYLTGQNDSTLVNKALESNPVSYLTKPVKKIDLIAAVKLIAQQQQLKYITIKDGYNLIKIPLDEILFAKSERNYIDIQLVHTKISIRRSLETLLKEIQSDHFLRIHRSYVVNTTKISKKKSSTVIINEFEIPYSRNIDFTI